MQLYKLLTGDVLETLKTLPSDFFDACLSDPPYGISFMGKEWDKGVPSAEVYTELLRVLKPGAMGLHFGGTRMWHRLAVNLEDAGFELRDTVMWLYGSGFPKSHNISKAIEAKVLTGKASMSAQRQAAMGADYEPTELAGTPGYGNAGARYTGTAGQGAELAISTEAAKQWEGWGTALKPAWEPALLVQKPLDKTYANNALTHGCGGLNIDGCRVGSDTISVHNAPKGTFAGGDEGRGSDTASYTEHTGRFPANLILDEEAGQALDEQSGTRQLTDKGGASRFFYCAKVSTKERNAGLGEDFGIKSAPYESYRENALDTKGIDTPYAGAARAGGSKNNHPTLKPLALTEYLGRLLLVPKRTDGQPRRILVPFSGAGSEVIGCLLAGWDEVWGIELNGDYVKIATARTTHHCPEARPNLLTCS